MKTAMKRLFEKYGHLLPDIEEKYIEQEKQQIIDSWIVGNKLGWEQQTDWPEDAENYYNQTYQQNSKP